MDLFTNFLRFPWFRRKWVVQEVAKASTVYIFCGESILPWVYLRNLAVFLDNGRYTDQLRSLYPAFADATVTTALVNLDAMIWAKDTDDPISLDEILVHTRHFDCSDRRDSLFALLGMVADAADGSLAADYSITLETVCRQLTSWQVEHQKSLNFMRRWWYDWSDEYPNLPTWVTPIDEYRSSFVRFSASKALHADARCSEDGAKLYVTGFAVDTVAELIDADYTVATNTAHLHQGDLATRFQQCKAMALEGGGHLSRERYEEFWRTFVCDQGLRAPRRAEAKSSEVFRQFMEALEMPHAPLTTRELGPDHQASFFPILNACSCSMRFCKMASGRLGQVLPASQVGDRVCVFPGCSVPVTIRETPEGTYSLLGECYCHGIMDGEALDLGIEHKIFVLI